MSPAERWKEITAGPESDVDLVEAALLIAAHEYPELDVLAYQARMDRIAATLKGRLRRDIGPAESIVALNRYLFEELGFRGNASDYYDPRNSFLNEVLDRKLGIPITLAVIYIEVGRHIGLALHGVSFPGHFLVKCPARDGVIVLDPCARGASLSLEDLQQRLRALRGGAAPPADIAQRMLAAAGKKDILSRMLRNLKGVYLQRRDFSRALAAADRREGVNAFDARLHRCIYIFTLDNTRGNTFDRTEVIGSNGTLAVNRLTKRVDDAADHAVADRH